MKNWQRLRGTTVLLVGILCLCQSSFASGINKQRTSPLTTKGDIYTFDTKDARLAVGSNGQILSADSSTATGLKWVTPSTSSGTVSNSGTLTSNAVIIGAGTTVVQAITADTATSGHFLASTATSPAFRQVLTTDVSGVGIASTGGTGNSSYTKGDILAASGSTQLLKLAVGSNGQVLTSDSAQTTGVGWTTAKSLLPTTTKGDLLVSNGADNMKLAVGANGTVLSADSSVERGVKWASPPGTPLTTKGDIFVRDTSSPIRLAVGTNGQVLSSESSQVSGLLWTGAKTILPTTTKGDLIVSNGTDNMRIAVGANGTVLSADSSVERGVKWASPPGTPLTTKGDIIVMDASSPIRLAVGANGTVLSADSSTVSGLKWVTPSAGAGGTPGGNSNQFQYNNGGSFGGTTVMTWDSANRRVAIGSGTGPLSLDVAGSFRTVPFALTDGTTIALDASKSNFFTVTLAGQPRTLSNPTNANPGQAIMIRISQDGTGSRKMGFGTAYKFGSDVPSYDASTTASSKDYIRMIYNGVSMDIVGISKGYR